MQLKVPFFGKSFPAQIAYVRRRTGLFRSGRSMEIRESAVASTVTSSSRTSHANRRQRHLIFLTLLMLLRQLIIAEGDAFDLQQSIGSFLQRQHHGLARRQGGGELVNADVIRN